MNIEIAPKHTEAELSYEQAMLYCFMLTVDGKRGWRVPTYAELVYIHTYVDYDLSGWYLSSKINHINGCVKIKHFKHNQDGFKHWLFPNLTAIIRPVRTIDVV